MDFARILGLKDKQALFVLSPHLDDAIWSLGAILKTLSTAGHEVVVITVFSDTTQTAVRKAEDEGALKEAGCEFRHLDFPDAILDGRPAEAVFNESFSPPQAAVEQIVAAVTKLVPPDAVMLAPGGFGVHVDHLTTRAVAASLPNKVFYYEDLPYAARAVRLAAAHNFFTSHNLSRQALQTPAEMISEHLRLYSLYASQRQDHHVEQIKTYLASHGFGIWAP